jgi:pyridoxal 5'-phosphate synthase pdxT subunit
VRVGVLALQGAFQEHLRVLDELGIEAVAVRLPRDLDGIDGLIMPGGESTAMVKLAEPHGLLGAIGAWAAEGRPIWGTCAGLVLLAREIRGHSRQPRLGLLDVVVARNAFGRQISSFEAPLAVPALERVAAPAERGLPFPGVFIRAPLVEGVGDGVEVLARLDDGRIVAVQQGPVLGTAFHPELTADRRFHRYFATLLG